MAVNVAEIGKPISDSMKRIWPTWQSVTEMMVLFGFAMLLRNLNWAEIIPFQIGMNVDPLWLPVIVMCVHYGLIEGLAAAVLACAARLYFDDAGFLLGDTLTTYALRTGTEPILWILFALLVGGLRTRQAITELRVSLEAKQYLHRSNLLARHYDQLQARTESLERFVATRLSEAGSRNGRRNTPSVHSNSVQDCISGLFATFNLALEGASFRIYLDNGAGLSRIRDNRRPGLSRTDVIHPESPLYEKVMTNLSTVCGVDDSASFPSDCNGIFACPIRIRGEEQAFGMLLIDSIHPSRLTKEHQEFYIQLCIEVGDVLAARGFADLLEETGSAVPTGHAAAQTVGEAANASLH